MDHLRPYIDRVLRVFISYSSKDKKAAGLLKYNLDACGFDTFLAHEDIELGDDWEQKIIQQLKSCDIFVPILSSSFKESDWASQEIGIAIELQKKILPLSFGINPYGFIRGIQAMKIDKKHASSVVDEIIDHLYRDSNYSKDLVDTVIRGLVNSNNFDAANSRAKILKKFDTFNNNQVSEIARGYLTNNQIKGGFESKIIVEKIMEDNPGRIDSEVLKQI